MTVRTRFRCLNCGERFEIEELTPDEVREARHRGRPISNACCPSCRRNALERY